ncbi:uncharacterized protein LOC120032971 [Salvelinus namaycush]|uniref:Uncharacterized protein LOC120032971 n=1 Tax=Salvelinus namaycush TaxID=8040 RepID=A0A8U0Q4F8_SALNM|nr:uncharacterized protein LOC120032971 [Salvelinus namaycush]
MLHVLLLTTLKELTEEQLKTFQSHLTRGWMLVFPPIPESQLKNSDRQDTVDQMVKRYGPEGAVRITLRILRRRMNLNDLAEKLQRDYTRVSPSFSGISTTLYKSFSQPSPFYGSIHPFPSSRPLLGLSQKLSLTSAGSSGQLSSQRPFMLDVPALLLTSLEELTEEQLKTFQSHLTSDQLPGFPPIPESQLENTDRQETVDQMVKRYGPERAVRNTLMILRLMNRVDLAVKLERDHTRGIPTASFQCFPPPRSYGSIQPFLSRFSSFLPSGSSKQLLSSISGSSGQLSSQRPFMLDVPALLLTSLEELTEEQLKTFQSHLTSDQLPGFPPIPESQLENTDRQETVDQMVKRYGPERAVRNTLMILRLMNRVDLAVKLERDHTRGIPTASFQCFPPPRSYGSIQPFLSRFSSFLPSGSSKQLLSSISGSSGQLSSQRTSMLDVLLLTTLEELTEEQLKTFQSHLTSGWMLGFPLIPESQLENTDRQDTVDQMVKRYEHEGAVRNTLMILKLMNRVDLAEKLERDHNGAWLLNSLEERNINELKTFQNYLTSGKLLGFPPIPKSQLRNTDRQVTVDLMMKSYGPERAVKITLRILRWMNEHDLTEKLQSDHTETAGPEEAVEITPEILKKMNWDDLSEKKKREWFPENNDQEDNGTYRLECPRAGLFQCSITGLVFRMEGEVLYRTVHWDMRLLAQNGKRPAGPLFKFTCLKGSVSQLHLPHCEICPGGGCDFLSVAHVTDDNIEFIPPHETTDTHVIINISGFCAYGLIKDKDAPVFPIKAQVLLFYQPSDDPDLESVLHVLLLPRNVVLMKVKEERARRNGMRETFIETTSDCELTPDQIYSLSTDGYHKVIPETKKFDNDKDYENYTTTFAVFLPAKVQKAELTLKKNIAWSTLDLLSSLFVSCEYPWKGFYRYQAPLPAATPAKPPTFPGRDFITKHRIALETRLGLLQPILLHLEDHKVLNAEEREEVVSKSTKTLQNQALLDMVVRKGDEAQEVFYQVLREADRFLVRDLEKKKS